LVDLKAPVGAHTIAEILSEPATWKSCLQAMEQTAELQSLAAKLPRNIEWVFIGCGSSFYLAQAASASWSILTGEKSRALPASEITLFPQLFPAGCQAVLITRSGYTSEVLQAAEYLWNRNSARKPWRLRAVPILPSQRSPRTASSCRLRMKKAP